MGLQNVKLHIVESIDDVLALSSWLGERRPHHALAFDTETTGLVVGVDRVRMVQVGDGVHGWAIPYERWGGLFVDLLRRWDGMWIAHNAKFDCAMLEQTRTKDNPEGVRVERRKVVDTRIMAHCMAPHMSTALKNVASRLIDAHASSLKTGLEGTNFTWDTVPINFQPYWTYAALDPVLTYQVYEVLWPQVQTDCPDAFHLENEVSWVIERMERYGAHVDVEYAAAKLQAFTEYVETSGAWIKEHYGVAPGSNTAIIGRLQKEGYEFTKLTKSGNALALDSEVLGAIDHPLAETVLGRRQIQKLASTYLSHFVAEVDADHLIHPSINVLGARTSRMSMERPNLQNLPRKNTINPAADAVRSCITARPGHTMLMCDFDQIEMRMLASMASEQSMINAFKGDEDFFVALAKLVYGDESIVKSDPRRQVVKNAGYATIYGAGVEKFSITAGITLEQGTQVRARWDELFPDVVSFQRRVIKTALDRRGQEGVPYVRCPVTRRRQIGDPGKEYALVNFLIQGAAAAVLKRKLIECSDAGLGDWMVVPVHDEIILDVPDEHVEQAARTLQEIMNDDAMFTVPITASVSYGPSWGSKETYP